MATILLRTFGYRHDAERAQEALRSRGIDSALIADDAGGAEAGLSFTNPVRLLVREVDQPVSVEILRQWGLWP